MTSRQRRPRVRELSRGGRRKNDLLDAAAAASAAAQHGDAVPLAAEGPSTVLKMLDERRTNLTQQTTRTVNQLHALLRELLPGGAATDLTADRALRALVRSDRYRGWSRPARISPASWCANLGREGEIVLGASMPSPPTRRRLPVAMVPRRVDAALRQGERPT